MPNNLFVLCGDQGSADLRRVSVSHDVQTQLSQVFAAYLTSFRDGIEDEIQFDRRWKPDEEEVLTLPVTSEIQQVLTMVEAGPLALPILDPNALETQTIRALLFSFDDAPNNSIVIQYFSNVQKLSRRGLALVLNGDTFTRLDGPAFSIGSKIDAVIEGGVIKFKNFGIIKRIFDVVARYYAASDAEIASFCESEVLHAPDIALICGSANQTIRKLISSVNDSGILSRVTVDTIRQRAASFGIGIELVNGQLILPTDMKLLKTLLTFLDNGIYESPIEENRFIANSKRPFG